MRAQILGGDPCRWRQQEAGDAESADHDRRYRGHATPTYSDMYSTSRPATSIATGSGRPAEGAHRAAGPIHGAGVVHDAGQQAEEERARRGRRCLGKRGAIAWSIRRAPRRAASAR